MIYSQINIRKLRVQRFDGDIMFTTNNNIMIENFNNTPVINCVQKTAEKKILDDPDKTEQILLESNKLGFGDEIGQVTNRVTSMFDVLCNFDSNSDEYKTLTYRIICGNKFIQDTIDRVKGIVCHPMPEYWYKKIKEPQDEEDEFNNRICADRKPYFMKYIYSDIKKDCDFFIDNLKSQSEEEFQVELEYLLSSDYDSLSEEHRYLVDYYKENVPVNDNTCVMNKLCHTVENVYKDYYTRIKQKEFDYTILKSNCGYSKSVHDNLERLYKDYCFERSKYMIGIDKSRKDKEEYMREMNLIKESFIKKCYEVCSDEAELCDAIIDICYSRESSKAFAWEMCGEQIIKNLLDKNNHQVKYLTRDDDGDIEYDGYKFSAKYVTDETL